MSSELDVISRRVSHVRTGRVSLNPSTCWTWSGTRGYRHLKQIRLRGKGKREQYMSAQMRSNRNEQMHLPRAFPHFPPPPQRIASLRTARHLHVAHDARIRIAEASGGFQYAVLISVLDPRSIQAAYILKARSNCRHHPHTYAMVKTPHLAYVHGSLNRKRCLNNTP